MWNLRHNADAITGDAVSVLAGAVFKLFDDLQRVVYCPMRSLSADIDNGTDSAGIMLAFLFGESMLMCLFHAFLSPSSAVRPVPLCTAYLEECKYPPDMSSYHAHMSL